jgi:heavy metal sensor kinase
MSLRARLTIIYTSLLGVVLVIFGVGVYAQVSAILQEQIDQKLESAVLDITQLLRMTDAGEFALVSLLSFDSSLTLQLWDDSGRVVDATRAVNPQMLQIAPLDPVGLNLALTDQERIYRDVIREGRHDRVLTVPLETVDGVLVGVIQAGTDMTEIDLLLVNLERSLLISGGVAIVVASVAGWLTTRRTLSPLSTVTRTASEITRADDLSRRIPDVKPKGDEVGELIQAFNQTLERLEDLFNAQRRFVADVGHELRTPLTVIRGNAEIMRREGQLDKDLLRGMEEEVDRLNRLVGDLLLLAQAESGKLPLNREMVEMDTVILEVFDHVHVLANGKKNLTIAEIDQVLVCGDQDRLKQVILNLVSNAVLYTQEGGEIVLSLAKSEDHACFAVCDNGPGIPEDDIPHIFERFYRGEKSRSRSDGSKGYGLGLSIAYWIVRNHGGEIDVQSVVGEGTTFSVRLPMQKDACP